MDILKPHVKRIKRLQFQIPESQKKLDSLSIIESKFMNFFDGKAHQTFLVMGVIAIVAVIFDFVLSTTTMRPLPPKVIPSEFKALIFSVIDFGVAILASGVFAIGAVAAALMKKRFRMILWMLCIIKVALFAFTQFKVGGKVDPKATIFMIALVVLVYVILDVCGGGLAFVFGKIKYWIQKQLIIPPAKIKYILNNEWNDLGKDAVKFNFLKKDVLNHFGLVDPPIGWLN